MINISPVGLAAAAVANQLPILVTIKEKLCRAICVDSTSKPQVSVVYTNNAATLVGTTVFVPVTATITIVTPGCGGKATTQLFTEKFIAAFQGQTALPTSVTIAKIGNIELLSNVCCGKASSITINDSLTITIA
jgi:ABC-type transport system involved in Fe-S cluster assembly fused permease/ATPase subunit